MAVCAAYGDVDAEERAQGVIGRVQQPTRRAGAGTDHGLQKVLLRSALA